MSALQQTVVPGNPGYAPAPGFRYHVELINGQEIEKPMPKNLHAFIQQYLILALAKMLPTAFVALPELDVLTGGRTADGRREYICPDVQVVPKDAQYMGMLAQPPLWGVEIMSPSQTLPDLFTRAERLLALGCPLLWVIWPEKRRAWEYRADDLIECSEKLTGRLPPGTVPESLEIDMHEMWAALDQ